MGMKSIWGICCLCPFAMSGALLLVVFLAPDGLGYSWASVGPDLFMF